MMALLPALAGAGQSGQSQQDQALNGVMPSKDGQQAADAQSGGGASSGVSAPGNNGGGMLLQMLSKLGQQGNNPNTAGQPGQVPAGMNPGGQQVMTNGTQPVSSLITGGNGTGGNGAANGSDFGAYLMQLMQGMGH